MRIIPALISAGLVVGVATAVVAQTAPTPTNPNTRVYAYQKSAPTKARNPAIQQSRAEETPVHGSAKWWETQNRFTGGEGGGSQ